MSGRDGGWIGRDVVVRLDGSGSVDVGERVTGVVRVRVSERIRGKHRGWLCDVVVRIVSVIVV